MKDEIRTGCFINYRNKCSYFNEGLGCMNYCSINRVLGCLRSPSENSQKHFSLLTPTVLAIFTPYPSLQTSVSEPKQSSVSSSMSLNKSDLDAVLTLTLLSYFEIFFVFLAFLSFCLFVGVISSLYFAISSEKDVSMQV